VYNASWHCDIELQRESKKSPLKLSAIFSSRLSIFSWDFARWLPVYIHMHLPILVYLSEYLTKWRYIFQEALIILPVSSFTKSDCIDFAANNEWLQFIRPQSLDYHVWGQCWSLITSCNRRQKQLPSFKMHFSLFGLPYRGSHWQHCERLLQTTASTCVSQWWAFRTYNTNLHNRY